MKSTKRLAVLIILLFAAAAAAQGVRVEVDIPDIPGYQTLTSDLHMHTVFSDGSVWPTVRTDEVWREGLDVFSITDHLEYRPHSKDIGADFNRSYEIARSGAESAGLILIRGTEVTRGIPPGHLNAIFIKDANPMRVESWEECLKIAAKQGAFIFFNHPGWYHKDNISRWYAEHDKLLAAGMLHGVEVVNGPDYYPEAHQWCIDKSLTMIGTSDVHSPISMDYDFSKGEHRPMTLAFVTEKSEAGFREALFQRRTVVYWKDKLIGDAQFLEPIFRASVSIQNPGAVIQGKKTARIRVHNGSEVPLMLEADGECEEVSFPAHLTIAGRSTVLMSLTGKKEDLAGKRIVELPVRVTNFRTAPETALLTKLLVPVTFQQK